MQSTPRFEAKPVRMAKDCGGTMMMSKDVEGSRRKLGGTRGVLGRIAAQKSPWYVHGVHGQDGKRNLRQEGRGWRLILATRGRGKTVPFQFGDDLSIVLKYE